MITFIELKEIPIKELRLVTSYLEDQQEIEPDLSSAILSINKFLQEVEQP